MKLSVIIVNYNVKYFLEQCLRSVLKASQYVEAEVFVVDNNSSDDSVAYLTPLFPEVTFISNKDNPGFSKANNQAIELAKGEYILLLNPDTVVAENTFSDVCRFMDEHPDGGALGVRMIDGFGSFLPESKRGFPSPWNSFCKIFGLSKIFPKSSFFGEYHLRYLEEDKTHEVDVLAGAFMLLRKSVLDKTGLLDDAFFMYGEDIDLSYRIILEGYKNYYFPSPIIHYKGESTKKDIKYVKTFYQAMLIFFNKHYPSHRNLYAVFIYLAIYMRASIDMFGKLISPLKKPKNFKKYNQAVFSTDDTSYKEIIDSVLEKKNAPTVYYIYHPETKNLVSPGKIQTGINKEDYGLS
jgi:GT2 family glycosyltransferase